MALRFLLIGYGIGVLAGLGAGFIFGATAGWLVAWLGGSGLSLALIYTWYQKDKKKQVDLVETLIAWDRDADEERLAADLRTEQAGQTFTGQKKDGRKTS